MAHGTLIEVDQQTIPLGIPLGIGLKIYRKASETRGNRTSGKDRAAHAGKDNRRETRKIRAIHVLGPNIALGVVEWQLAAGVGLVHIEETSQMNAPHMHAGNIQ